MQLPHGVGTDGIGYGVDYPIFWIDRYHPHSVRQHTAFAASSRAGVDAFYAAAPKAGGNDNGAPGLRQHHLFWIRTGIIWKRYFVAIEHIKIQALPVKVWVDSGVLT